MDLLHDTETIEDLSALAWVHDELRRSLETAHKSMRRYLKEADAAAGSDVDAVDPSVLRSARAQLHQSVGALELVDLPTAAQVLRASEAALQKLTGRPIRLDAAAIDIIEQASFALLDYLARQLAGKPVSPLALFPQYRAAQELAGADRVHPADLWPHDWQWQEVAGDGSAPRQPDAQMRSEVEAQTLAHMRQGDSASALALSELFAGLAAGALERKQRTIGTLWQIAAAFFEAQGHKLLKPDVYSKRVASRLLAQLRLSEGASAAPADVSERLAQDLLFFCAQAASPGDGRKAPRLAAVRAAWNLARRAPVDYKLAVLGKHDPASIAQAKKRVAAAKDSWSSVAGGELHRLSSLNEQFVLVGDSLKKHYPSGDKLAQALSATAAQTAAAGAVPPPALAMEMATSLLFLEASLEDADFDHPSQAERVQRLAARLDRVRGGAEPEVLDAWMEELYRRVSDRQTMGSVVQELKTSLAESEKAIDQYFRNPAQRELLHPVPSQLNSMRGVFSVLGMEHASHAVVRMRDDIDLLAASTELPPPGVATDRLAGNLGALGFLVDMLNVQPAMAKSLFAFDAESGQLRAVAAGGKHRASSFGALDTPAAGPAEPRLIEQAQSLAVAAAHPNIPLADVRQELDRLSQEAMVADQPELAETMHQVKNAFEVAASDDERRAVREELAHAMADFVQSTSDSASLEGYSASRPMPILPATPTPAGQTGLEEDVEMREIFLEEACEVIGNAEAALTALAEASDDLGEMTTVRRAFHTLKGSSRMVGLTDFGEAAWACEQLYNTRLADQQSADAGLLGLTNDVLAYLADWVATIGARRMAGHSSRDVQLAIHRFKQDGAHAKLGLPGDQTPGLAPLSAVTMGHVSNPMALDLLAELPSAADLDLVPAGKSAVQPIEHVLASTDSVEFELDLGEAAAMPAGGRDAFQSLVAPEREPDAPAPDISSGLMSLEFAPSDHAVLPAAAPDQAAGPMRLTAAEPEPQPLPRAAPEPEPPRDPEADNWRSIGPLRVAIPLFNIFLNESDEQSRRLVTELAEWSHDVSMPMSDSVIALAHSLAGNSATVGHSELSQLARSLEHALMRSQAVGSGDAQEARLFNDSASQIRHLLHQFAAGFLKPPAPELMARLADHERMAADRLHAASVRAELGDDGADSGAMALDAVPEVAAHPEAAAPAALPEAIATPDVEAERAAPAGHAEPPALQPVAESHPPAPADVVAPTQPMTPAPTLGQTEYHELSALTPLDERPRVAAVEPVASADGEEGIDAVDAVDAELFPFFQEEAQELLPQLSSRMRDWANNPAEPAGPAACMRTLHTIKGGARLAGAMRLGELAHRLETVIEHLAAKGAIDEREVEALFGRVDAIGRAFDRLAARPVGATADAPLAQSLPVPIVAAPIVLPPTAAVAEPATHPPQPVISPAPTLAVAPMVPKDEEAPAISELPAGAEPAPPAQADGGMPAIDWGRFAALTPAGAASAAPERALGASSGTVRVRAPLLDRLVNHAGEVMISRSRIESEVVQLKGSLGDLTENLERLRSQLRDIELQAETQISSRIEAAKAIGESFDPLEMDRFTRFQELTRMMAESVNDVATVQRSLQRTVQSTEDELAAQARLTRDMQDDLLRTRMVEFESLSDRLYRVARQAAKELQKQVRLDIVGGSIEVDRGVLERMGGAFEHLLRNCVAHGIELPVERERRGKDPVGQITVSAAHEGNEVAVEFRDDGAGLDFSRIRQRGIAIGLIAPEAQPSDGELVNLIFTPGFSTAASVTELAGRGVGMDVVRSEVNALGGRIETASAAGQGTSFRLVLPLTTAVTQVVMLRAGAITIAVPSTLIEVVKRVAALEVQGAYASAQFDAGERPIPFFWLGALLQATGRSAETPGRNLAVVVVKSAAQRIALHVDEVLGNQEVVVKNLGPQLARLPGLAGVTLLASGLPALIYNPVALATLYGDGARAAMRQAVAPAAPNEPQSAEASEAVLAPLVLVVDDSLTVRRVTQRLLVREGYRVTLAKDGLDALEKLAEELPVVVLSDIEMPRMDGFDLVRNLRADPRLNSLPVIMITSRIAQKHREHAAELGVEHYLGKPYSEDDLLGLLARYAATSARISIL
jgi:chemosensory pili system protein ChpA (sensor histidine kinase/response regulator)